MNRIQLRPPPSLEKEQEYSSSPCLLHRAESDFGYWTRDEERTFLNELLKLERNGTRLKLAGQLTCVLLILFWRRSCCFKRRFACFYAERSRQGAENALSAGTKRLQEPHGKLALCRTILVASSNHQGLVEAIQSALLKLGDSQLRGTLGYAEAPPQEHRTS